jgi:mercuric ion transport protein
LLRELLRRANESSALDLMRVVDGSAAHNGLVRAEVAPPAQREHRVLGYLSLFTSVGTLLCCALPSLLVLLGLGATVASVLASAPWLVAVSRHKSWVFATSAILIAGNFYYVYRLAPRLLVRSGACAIDDPTCARATRTSRIVLWTSGIMLLIGFAVAYVLPVVLESLDA